MTAADFAMIQRVITREGGFVDHPNDKGGPTNMGITLTTLTLWLGRKATVDEVKGLSVEQARDIYFEVYLVRPNILSIDDAKVREAVFDEAVNSGPGTAIRHFQRALGVKDDGVLGPVTLARWHTLVPLVVIIKLFAERMKFYASIITRDSTQRVFAAGWMNRLAGLMEELVA